MIVAAAPPPLWPAFFRQAYLLPGRNGSKVDESHAAAPHPPRRPQPWRHL
jgi:hypothetical protein